jgi:hypothetical protein
MFRSGFCNVFSVRSQKFETYAYLVHSHTMICKRILENDENMFFSLFISQTLYHHRYTVYARWMKQYSGFILRLNCVSLNEVSGLFVLNTDNWFELTKTIQSVQYFHHTYFKITTSYRTQFFSPWRWIRLCWYKENHSVLVCKGFEVQHEKTKKKKLCGL